MGILGTPVVEASLVSGSSQQHGDRGVEATTGGDRRCIRGPATAEQ
ncbi:hypothetical protein PC116_g22628 [Phytophthora cactorum]|nr:hypothetical protein PC120_g17735 [Phytophthora cactorum]KAG3159436.1 hypothetical protein PC128_g21296 [Phytophthora cactorum]KAG4044368.1 hypothetical protein PC123_g20186 [Phytophthora cactorum]KAG4229030.1 hypothetical protein PC116_g22628 [Phytophthora cactorum]